MFILEKPYVSEYLIDTIVKNDWTILDNTTIEEVDIEADDLHLITTEKAKKYYLSQEYPFIYGNSEKSASWVLEHLPDSKLANYINNLRNKGHFRELLKEMYPDFYFKVYDAADLKDIEITELRFPFVIKPICGYLGNCVHVVNNEKEWKETVDTIIKEVKESKNSYLKDMLDTSSFIIEDYIEGEEFAIDAYFDRNGEPVILNIYQHPYLNSKDLRNTIYLMSTGIMIRYMAKFGLLLREIGNLMDIKNLPIHMELRVTKDDKYIPIEISPLRFAAWCASDVAKYAWGINVYEMYYKQEHPDWNSILNEAGKGVFYFSTVDVPKGMAKNKIEGFQYDRYLQNFSNVLEVRRIDPTCNPFALILFGQTYNKDEVLKILSLKVNSYFITK